jgi:3-deoxy-D-manno-octulosonic-acid transferase
MANRKVPLQTFTTIKLLVVFWFFTTPILVCYFWWRGRHEPEYRQNLIERFGRPKTSLHRPIWVHAASLGEVRGVAPLWRALLDEGNQLFMTTLTPAGRQEIQLQFSHQIQAGQAQAAYAPLEIPLAIKGTIRRLSPRAVLVCESESWPVWLRILNQFQVRVALVNAKYPARSLARDTRWGGLRSAVYRHYDLVLCKSSAHAARFTQVGCTRVEVTGETRFDLPLPHAQLQAAQPLRAHWATAAGRAVVCLASTAVAEDEALLAAAQQVNHALTARGVPAPLWLLVPRRPARFDGAHQAALAYPWRVARRSACLATDLSWRGPTPLEQAAPPDVLLGDSLGEMHFYLALCDVVVVGDSFVPRGGHNIIEPLAQQKPVLIGPSVTGIEYPFVEAQAAGVVRQLPDTQALADELVRWLTQPQELAQWRAKVDDFFQQHRHATAKHMAVLRTWLPPA